MSSATPENGENQHQTKSYADAVEQEAPAPAKQGNGTTPTPTSNGANKFLSLSHSNGSVPANGKLKKKASVLRIVDTDSEKTNSKKNEEENKRPEMERQESKHVYSAEGLDDAPRSPPRHSRKKNKSLASSSKNEKSVPANGAQEESKPEKLDANTVLKDSTNKESTVDHEESEGQEESRSEKLNPDLVLKESTNKESTVVHEEPDNESGDKLVSIKTSKEFEEQTKLDKMEEKKRDRHLDSGRQAGKRWQQSAIRWAPLNVPLQRRLQTAIVLAHTLCIAISMSAFFFLCAIPLFWPLLVPYMLYCIFSTASTSGTLSHRSNFIRSLPIWSLFASYFPARLHRSQVLPPTRKYIFGYHPHGIISHGAYAAFATEALGFSQLFPGIKNTLLTLDTNFRIPLYRDYALAMGLASVSKESCENILSKGGANGEGMGRAITIVVGGARESLDAQPHTLRLVLKCRKGFVKLAIRTGADLVPVLAFGENDLYDQFNADAHPTVHKFQMMVKRCLGFTIPLFHARGVFNYDVGLLPYRRALNVVVGRPIRVQVNKNPEQAEIDRVHAAYVEELERLWDTWKDDFAKDREGELVIVE